MFLHSALTEALLLTSSAIPAAEFTQVYRELLQVDPVKRKRNIQSTYDVSTCLPKDYATIIIAFDLKFIALGSILKYRLFSVVVSFVGIADISVIIVMPRALTLTCLQYNINNAHMGKHNAYE